MRPQGEQVEQDDQEPGQGERGLGPQAGHRPEGKDGQREPPPEAYTVRCVSSACGGVRRPQGPGQHGQEHGFGQGAPGVDRGQPEGAEEVDGRGNQCGPPVAQPAPRPRDSADAARDEASPKTHFTAPAWPAPSAAGSAASQYGRGPSPPQQM